MYIKATYKIFCRDKSQQFPVVHAAVARAQPRADARTNGLLFPAVSGTAAKCGGILGSFDS